MKYNALVNTSSKLKDDLLAVLRRQGITSENGIYKIEYNRAVDYLMGLYENLPPSTASLLLDLLILGGYVDSERVFVDGIEEGVKWRYYYILVKES